MSGPYSEFYVQLGDQTSEDERVLQTICADAVIESVRLIFFVWRILSVETQNQMLRTH